jgi:hypothetical protein
MAAIAAISNVAYGDRSVSFTAVSAGVADTLDFSVIAAALTAAGVASSTIKSFLSTSHTDAAGTMAAIAAAGGLVAGLTTGNVAAFVSADNQLTLPLAATWQVRIALAHTISA